ncbi:SOUL hem-binding protein [Dillenia turbinata]|uniref:SOUL hem-binding protein n=1 Tax=Dillenia turbinata TaxID=194707 RepID=A0AAN8UZH1_9MAGN
MEIIRLMIMAVNFLWLIALCSAIETPQYTVIHRESNFEIRLMRESSWMSAPVKELSFEKATRLGFHRLFEYIQGANLNFSRIAMTAPLLTSVVPDAGPLHSSAYHVQLYLPVAFQETPPTPLPELNLEHSVWPSRCLAVRTFSGFARDSNVVKEAEKLAVSLSRSPWANATTPGSVFAYSIAQYSPPLRIFGRINEVWVDISGSILDDCKSIRVSVY